MTFSEIKGLLDRFYEGQSTLAEEQQLRDFFLSGDYPDEMSEDAEYFLGISVMAKEEIPDEDFEKTFMERISGGKKVVMHPLRSRFYYTFGIAASILILAGLFLTFRYELLRKPASRNNPDLELAYQQTENALLLVSSGLNTGLQAMERLDAFGQGINDMQRILVFNKYQSIIINPDEFSKTSTKNQ